MKIKKINTKFRNNETPAEGSHCIFQPLIFRC